jgi:hypothetical protein
MKYGLKNKQDPRDLLLGSESNQGYFDLDVSDWKPYLPTNEKQHSLYFDTLGCATFAKNNQAETFFNYLLKNELLSVENANWLNNNGYIDENGKVNFSDRFEIIQNGTTTSGNYFTKVYQSAYDEETGTGMIPEKMLPYPIDQRTPVFDRDDYFDPSVITNEMRELGREFLRRFTIRYYGLYQGKENRDQVLRQSPLLCGVRTRCTEKVNCSGDINHAVLYYTPELLKGFIPVYDSYESPDKDFIRLMGADYQFPNNMRAIKIKENKMTNTKIIANKAKGKELGFYLPIHSEDAFISMAGNFGIEVPKKDGKVDWENVKIDGETSIK